MDKTISRLYAKTKNKVIVANAVMRGWITEQQYFTITGEEYSAV